MQKKCGFTLVELLVVIAIVGLLVGLLLPAINSARESGRRVTCKNNLRQQAIAIRSYAQQYPEQLPAMWQSDNQHPWENFSWRVELLPFMEEGNRHAGLNKSASPLSPENVRVAGPIPMFECPSSPGSPRVVRQYGGADLGKSGLGVTDYVAVFDVRPAFQSIGQSGVWYGGRAPDTLPTSPGRFRPGSGEGILLGGDFASVNTPAPPDVFNAKIRTVPSTLRKVRDGLSNTAMLVEQAGKPSREGKNPAPQNPTEGAWLASEYASFYAPGINQDNHSGPYGYHTGAMAAMCDGSVHFWSRQMAQDVMNALLTREGSEIINDTDWQN